MGTHDFSAFCSAGSSVEDRVRTITACGMRREGERVTFFVEGDGFLYNMVRIMVGTVLEIAAGIKAPAASHRSSKAATARWPALPHPAWGLYLDQVFYDNERLEQRTER